jgi:hypothetical protein
VIPLPSSDRQVAGVFLPSPAFSDIAPAMQVRLEFVPGRPTIREPLTSETGSPLPLRRMSEAERAGLPPDDLWQLKDGDGAVLDTEMILLEMVDVPDVPDVPGEFADACRAAGISGVAWVLSALRPND